MPWKGWMGGGKRACAPGANFKGEKKVKD